jgi:glucosamine--fructose-6-phosphate aminotransferase (isomerizing)
MCGIVAVLRRPSERTPPTPAEIDAALCRAEEAGAGGDPDQPEGIERLAEALEALERVLAGAAGLQTLVTSPEVAADLDAALVRFEAETQRLDRRVDAGGLTLSGRRLEARNAALVRLKDVVWALSRDRLGVARAVAELAGPQPAPAAVEAFASVQAALAALDRLEVRGRDSAGLHVLVDGHGLDLDDPQVAALSTERLSDRLFTSGAVRTPCGRLSLVYKAAAEIGELGDNTRALRAAIRGDDLLHRAVAAPTARVTVLGHTRWASVGIVSEANAHPLNHEEEGGPGSPYVAVAVNGDVDNHVELRQRWELRIHPEITCDTKVVPALVSRQVAGGLSEDQAFRATVAGLHGSLAIAASTAQHPERLLLALRGSGQALYVGLADDAFVVASEPYGVVGETRRYLRMDGGAAVGADGRPGQVVVLDADRAGTVAGVTRTAYDGTPLPVADDDIKTAEVTTRDIDRGEFPHYLLKELSEAPRSLTRTTRGRIQDRNGVLTVVVDDDVLPPALRQSLAGGAIRQVLAIGQGTAAVAARSVAVSIAEACGRSSLQIEALLATELSGFRLEDDMSDTLVVAVSQSGTTTDTNRTVDLVRARGAAVVAIVNRRNSDLVEKATGVLYTSDGRDVEMSVASTKAFYGQVAAGFLLGEAIAEVLGCADRARSSQLLDGLRRLPAALEAVLAQRPAIAEAARHVPTRQHWAVVGNGPNRVAAEEVRIKLSELCYRAIACDATEDKKHIDLSSEPLVFVCAAGLSEPNADDVGKEVAIYRAHRGAPIVVATEGQEFPAALATITVPAVHPSLAFVLSAMAGHLFGYEAALAIDASALPLREGRAAVESALAGAYGGRSEDGLLERLRPDLEHVARRVLDGLRSGAYDGTLSPGTAVQLALLLRYAAGMLPLEAYEVDFGKVGLPSIVVGDLTNALTVGIDELTRPVDAIKHQAKTVTVGISRSEDALLEAPLVQEVLAVGVGVDRLGYRALRTLAALGPAVAEVTGHTYYRIEGSVADDSATLHVVDKGGVAAGLRSRAETDPSLRGTKHRVAAQRQVTVAVGARDERTVLIVPEVKDNAACGLALLHIRPAGRLPAAQARAVLEGYQGRYAALADAVTETEPVFRDEVLGEVPIVELLTVPVHVLAQRWRSR